MPLKDLRKAVNQIDRKLVALLNERVGITCRIGDVKVKNGEPIYAPQREKEVFETIRGLNKGPLSDEALMAVYREIMSGALALEKPLKVSYLGSEGTYSHLAATRKFGSQLQYEACATIHDVFKTVEKGNCDYGVVPIENSVEGIVTDTIDLLVDSNVWICSEILVRIRHNLMSKTTLGQIKTVFSNPQVFGQCRAWLLKNLPKAELVSTASTTVAAQRAKKTPKSAALGSALASEIYGLKILARDIQDSAHNTTRFFVISTQDVPPTGKDRTSIVFAIKHQVGALVKVLEPFHRNRINMTKIESRPYKKKAWEYYFFVDLEGHQQDPSLKRALKEVEKMCQFLKVLGSYPVLK